MKTNVHFKSHLAQFFLEWEMFQGNIVQKIKTQVWYNNFFCFRKSFLLWDNMGKNVVEWGRQQMIICGMRIACRIPKATYTHSEYVILLFHCNSGCTNEPQCYVTRTLPLCVRVYDWLLVRNFIAFDLSFVESREPNSLCTRYCVLSYTLLRTGLQTCLPCSESVLGAVIFLR
jgi:hypothetical protein